MKEIKRISVEKKENIVATFPWKEGYAVAKQILGREKKVQSKEVVYIDLQKGEFKKNKNFSREDIEVDQIGFVGENKLAFVGVKGTSKTDICYGYLNLKNGELIAYEEKNYNASLLENDNDSGICVRKINMKDFSDVLIYSSIEENIEDFLD